MNLKPKVPPSTGVKDCYLPSKIKILIKTLSLSRSITRKLAIISLVAGILLINGCQNKRHSFKNMRTGQEKELASVKRRVEKLESQINSETNNSSQENFKQSASPIKSITFRIGTRDDRLRIYWKNGSNSDLPCMKEQSTWICG